MKSKIVDYSNGNGNGSGGHELEEAFAKHEAAYSKLQTVLSDMRGSPTPVEVPSTMFVDLVFKVLDKHGDNCADCEQLRMMVNSLF